ncbi:polyadenylate-binding protein-interacting protein 5-like [Impatiens glandulifera]|uniref:polyadenylate-binding protein-interacting protein 5-like n=1 Tax=Impatiens glandulifera TaxID=253017 RepID=UPI001FB05756|nr:polyadenylate-binding protein-interacting protein 5-like [Impatiens glandulifera]
MKSGKSSSLNPYAEPYIPLSRRNEALKEIDYNLMGNDDLKDVNLNHHQYQQTAALFDGSTSESSNRRRRRSAIDDDKETNMEEEFDMGLTYLEMIFPGISEESLAEVFLANKGDLEATVEMLRQLEMDIDDCCEYLPDSLDIGDVIEQPKSSNSQDEMAVASSSSSIRLDSKSKDDPYV